MPTGRGPPMEAARPTDTELNTYERTLKTVIKETMGNRAAAIFALAEIMTIPGNEWVDAEPGRYYSGTAYQVRKWTKAQREQIQKPLPRR